MRFLSILFFLLFNNCLSANATQEVFEKANAAYQNKQFSEAIQQYRQLLEQDFDTHELYYNLAGAYYKNGEIGKAVLFYERALLKDANDADTKHNLATIERSLQDEFSPIQPFFLKEWWENIRAFFSSTIWTTIFLFLLWVSAGGFIIWLYVKVRQQKKWGFILGNCLLMGSIFALAFAYSSFSFESNPQTAVIIEKETGLRPAPDEDSKAQMLLHEGTKVQLLDEIGSWFKVEIPNGDQGWLSKVDVVQI